MFARIALIDIDNVIADSTWREYLINEKGWDAYHQAAIEDQVCQASRHLLNALCSAGDLKIILLTGRPEKYRQLTMTWLLANSVYLDDLMMRPNDDFRKAPEMKLALVQSQFKNPTDEIAFIIDDRLDIIEAFRAVGIPGFQAFTVNVR